MSPACFFGCAACDVGIRVEKNIIRFEYFRRDGQAVCDFYGALQMAIFIISIVQFPSQLVQHV